MAYQALYRKWRPMTFDDVVGQEHITKTLKNEIINSQLAHAYLFCGTRGTGKTSTAKILARAVNCENPQNGNPCNECDICRGILDESITDVLELDGASRNKVENIRDIIEDVTFLPSRCKKKVYIIDEVHMVTTAAFNALLKTLEEPPEHVMFILATTELNKVPATVLSRCQRFDFRRITNETISARLRVVCDGDGRKVTDEALSLVAELGNGSMRDSLSILDQCIGFGDETLGYDDVLNIIGITDYDALCSVCAASAEGNAEKALMTLENVISCGKEIDLFIDSLVKFIRDLTIVKLMQNPENILNVSAQSMERMKELCEKMTKEKLINCLKILNESVAQAKALTFKRTVYELAFIKMCDPSSDCSFESLTDRIAELEEKLKNGNFIAQGSRATDEKPKEKKQTTEKNTPDEVTEKQDNIKQEFEDKEEKASAMGENELSARWEEIKAYIRAHGGMPLLPHISNARPVLMKNKIALVFGGGALMSKTVVSKQSSLTLIAEAVKAVSGIDLPVGCFTDKEVLIPDSGENAVGFSKIEELAKKHNIIEIID